jgi:hypothetical protein
MATVKKIKKAQTGGTYYASSKGRVGRISGSKIGDRISAVQNESIDTTGYGKGKKDFTKTINRTFEKPTEQKVKRADVPTVISELKKGAGQKLDLRTPKQRKQNELKSGGSVAKDGKWIQKAIKKPGALRAQLGAKPGKPIAAAKLAAAAKKPGKLGQRARLAQTLKKMKK